MIDNELICLLRYLSEDPDFSIGLILKVKKPSKIEKIMQTIKKD